MKRWLSIVIGILLLFRISQLDNDPFHECEYVPVAGLYTAASDLQVEWLVVKGVGNYADGSKIVNEKWSEFACANAASLVAKILSDSDVFKTWPHYQGKDDNANKGRFVCIVIYTLYTF